MHLTLEVVETAKKSQTKKKKTSEKAQPREEPAMNPEFDFELEGDPNVMWIPKDQLFDDLSVCISFSYIFHTPAQNDLD